MFVVDSEMDTFEPLEIQCAGIKVVCCKLSIKGDFSMKIGLLCKLKAC